jgi:hypothetical protein
MNRAAGPVVLPPADSPAAAPRDLFASGGSTTPRSISRLAEGIPQTGRLAFQPVRAWRDCRRRLAVYPTPVPDSSAEDTLAEISIGRVQGLLDGEAVVNRSDHQRPRARRSVERTRSSALSLPFLGGPCQASQGSGNTSTDQPYVMTLESRRPRN